MDDHAEAMRTLLEGWGWALPSSDTRWQSVKCGGHDDRRASARVWMEAGAYYCHTCGLSAGNPVGLVMAVKGLGYGQACDYLRALKIDPTAGDGSTVEPGPKRPWKGMRARSGSVSEWRRQHA